MVKLFSCFFFSRSRFQERQTIKQRTQPTPPSPRPPLPTLSSRPCFNCCLVNIHLAWSLCFLLHAREAEISSERERRTLRYSNGKYKSSICSARKRKWGRNRSRALFYIAKWKKSGNKYSPSSSPFRFASLLLSPPLFLLYGLVVRNVLQRANISRCSVRARVIYAINCSKSYSSGGAWVRKNYVGRRVWVCGIRGFKTIEKASRQEQIKRQTFKHPRMPAITFKRRNEVSTRGTCSSASFSITSTSDSSSPVHHSRIHRRKPEI